jgi:hypothetical protein
VGSDLTEADDVAEDSTARFFAYNDETLISCVELPGGAGADRRELCRSLISPSRAGRARIIVRDAAGRRAWDAVQTFKPAGAGRPASPPPAAADAAGEAAAGAGTALDAQLAEGPALPFPVFSTSRTDDENAGLLEDLTR